MKPCEVKVGFMTRSSVSKIPYQYIDGHCYVRLDDVIRMFHAAWMYTRVKDKTTVSNVLDILTGLRECIRSKQRMAA